MQLKMNYLSFFAILLLLSVVVNSEDSQYRNIVLKKIANFGNKKYIKSVAMPRKPVNRTTSLTSIEINIQPDVVLDSPLYVHFIANKKFENGVYKPYFINVKYELCDMLKFRNHPFLKIMSEIANRSENNLLEPCPLKGQKFVKPYYTSYESIPVMPSGSWRLDMVVTTESDRKVEEVLRNENFYEITAK